MYWLILRKTLLLTPGTHDKLGILHCGVTREGYISVAGDQRHIGDEEDIIFEKVKVNAIRRGSQYSFSRVDVLSERSGQQRWKFTDPFF